MKKVNITISGKPGSGKTHTAYIIFLALKFAGYSVSLDDAGENKDYHHPTSTFNAIIKTDNIS